MGKNQKQKLYDDLESLIDKYPRMQVSAMISTTEAWLRGVFHRLPPAKKGKPYIAMRVKSRYRLG